MRGKYCVNDSQGVIECFRTKKRAQKFMAKEVKASASYCRKSYKHKRCSAVGSVRDGHVTIKIGGRQGYHMWNRFSITKPGW